MSEVFDTLTNKVYFIATTEGDQPRVRPFGSLMEENGKLYFTTNNQKEVYKQLLKNPKFELAAMTSGGDWARLEGEAAEEHDQEIKNKAFERSPRLKQLYKGADDPILAIFSIINAKATLYTKGEIIDLKF